MEISTKHDSDRCTLSISGRLDAATSGELEDVFEKQLKQGVAYIVLDMQNLELVSSAGLRVILVAGKALDEKGGKMALCGMKPDVTEVIHIAGFDKVFPLANNVEQAWEAITA